jgi:hypothetical protein
VTAGAGTFTTLGTRVGTILALPNKMTHLDLDIPITTNGTAATNIQVTLPAGMTAARTAYFQGREDNVSGKEVVGKILAGTGFVLIQNYDNTYPGANRARIGLSGWFVRTKGVRPDHPDQSSCPTSTERSLVLPNQVI